MNNETLKQALKRQWDESHKPLEKQSFEKKGKPFDATAPQAELTPKQRLRRLLFERVLQDVEHSGLDYDDSEKMQQRIRSILSQSLDTEGLGDIAPAEQKELEDAVIAELFGYGPLEPLFADPSISDILINGPQEVWIDRFGKLEQTHIYFDDADHLLRLLERMVAGHGRHLEEATPYVDARLRDGSRLHAMLPPLSNDGPVIAIRRARATPLTLQDLIDGGTLSAEIADFLTAAVASGQNILLSGGAASGKTTLLNIIAQFIPQNERIITLEETRELQLDHPHVVNLETRLPNTEGRGEVSLRTLVRNALRLRADRIIVGEVRGEEVLEMLQAMNIGHNGSLTTVHANNPEDAIRRLETLVMLSGKELPSKAVNELIGSAFSLIVQLSRYGDGKRRITAVQEVQLDKHGVSTHSVFTYDEKSEVHTRTPHIPLFQRALDYFLEAKNKPGNEG